MNTNNLYSSVQLSKCNYNIKHKKNNLNYFLGESNCKNDCSSKIVSFNPSKLSSPNLFLSNLKYRMKYYGCENSLDNDILEI